MVLEVAARPETDPDSLAFQLLMVRLNSCLTCDARRYAERGGCARCASTNLAFCKDTEADLIARFRSTRKEIASELSKPVMDTAA